MGSATAVSRPAGLAALAALATLAGRVLRPFVSARTWLELAYLLAGLPMGVAGVMVPFFGLPFSVFLIALALSGIPLLAVILAVIDLPCRLLGRRRARRPRRGRRRRADDRQPARRADPHHRGAAMRVVIAEDSVLVREGLTRLLSETGIDVVAATGDAETFLRAVDAEQPSQPAPDPAVLAYLGA
ncbi:MAG: hypothetical protein ACRDPO_34695 [Streptosporangiaceae bacterium]